MRKTVIGAAAAATVAVTGLAFAQERQPGQEPAAGQMDRANRASARQERRARPFSRKARWAKSATGKAEKWAQTRRSGATKDQQTGSVKVRARRVPAKARPACRATSVRARRGRVHPSISGLAISYVDSLGSYQPMLTGSAVARIARQKTLACWCEPLAGRRWLVPSANLTKD
jgi:hypothetical protein